MTLNTIRVFIDAQYNICIYVIYVLKINLKNTINVLQFAESFFFFYYNNKYKKYKKKKKKH